MIYILSLLLLLVFADNTPNPEVIDFSRGRDIAVDNYNRLLTEGYAIHADWVKDPASIVLHLSAIPPEEVQNGKPVVTYESIHIASDQSIVLVISIENLLDDSVAAEKLRFRLISLENRYQFTEIKLLMKCQFGHGHSYFSGQICN